MSTSEFAGRIILLSGSNGKVLQWVQTPDGKETYYSPQLLTGVDGTDYVLFGTGGENSGGGLYILSLTDLRNGAGNNVKSFRLTFVILLTHSMHFMMY